MKGEIFKVFFFFNDTNDKDSFLIQLCSLAYSRKEELKFL